MNFILTCESCEEKFNEEDRQPVILPDCGHTFCEQCVAKLLSQDPSTASLLCPNEACRRQIQQTDPASFLKNHKILALLANSSIGKAKPGGYDPDNFIYCPRHYDKPIEYFCKLCTLTVCVKCIFDEHNGHELIQIEEMASSLKQNVLDLQKMILNAQRLNDENSKLLEQVQEELKRLKFQQMKNIDKGFFDLQKKLEDKKQEIKNEFEKRFKKEEQKFLTKHSLIVANLDEISNIEKVFDQLLNFIDSNVDAKILQRANDITTFMHKSFTDLDIITKNMISQKSEIYIHPSFKPLTLNVKKALDIVNKFEMTPSAGGPAIGAPATADAGALPQSLQKAEGGGMM